MGKALAARLAAATVALAGTLASPAFAQTESGAAASTETDSDSIIVTATKREEDINSVPMSITAVTGSELTELGVTGPTDLARVVPGFIAANTYFGSPVYYLRGVGFYDTAMAARPAVSMYTDEVPIPFGSMAMGTTLDLARVEVLRGPQGTLFGTNATGGAINFVAAAPTETFTSGVTGSYGTFNDVRLDGYVSGPLTSELLARIAISHRQADDWQRSYTSNATNGATNVTSARVTLDWRPMPELSWRLRVSGTQDSSDTIAPQLIGRVPMSLVQPEFLAYPLAPLNDARAAGFSSSFPTFNSTTGNTTERDSWVWQAALRGDYELTPNITLTSITGYSEASQGHGYEGDGTPLAVTDLFIGGDIQALTQEFRASGDVGDRLSWIVGTNFESTESAERVTFYLPVGRSGNVFAGLGLAPIDIVPQITNQSTDSWAVFGNVDFDLTSTLTAHVGVRYTETETDFNACTLVGGNQFYALGMSASLGVSPAPGLGECATFTEISPGVFQAGLVERSLSENNVSWRLGLDWTPFDGTLLYGSVSRGYKAGSFSNISSVMATQYNPAPQEELTAYEIGVKTEIIPNTLHLNAALFYYDYADKQLLGTVPVPVFIALTALVSVPESHVQGAEFEINLRPFEGFTLNAAATYVESEVDGHPLLATVFGPIVDIGGTEFPNTPNWQANIGGEYRWDLSDRWEAFVNTNVTYRGESMSDFMPDPRLAVDSYTLWDAQIGVETQTGAWRLALWGRNLTDEVYATTIVRRQEALVRTVGMPRTYGVSLSHRY